RIAAPGLGIAAHAARAACATHAARTSCASRAAGAREPGLALVHRLAHAPERPGRAHGRIDGARSTGRDHAGSRFADTARAIRPSLAGGVRERHAWHAEP